MGLNQSKADGSYYDQNFGHNFQKKLTPLAPGEVNKAIYVPANQLKQNRIKIERASTVQQFQQDPQPRQTQLVALRQPPLNGVPLQANSTKGDKKIKKNKKHPQKGRTYYYLEEPDVVFYAVPPAQQQQPSLLALPSALPQPVPQVLKAPQTTILPLPQPTLVPSSRRSRRQPTELVQNQLPRPFKNNFSQPSLVF